jgi:hypothetical protein
VHSLEANGMRCWIAPRDISPGKSWSEAIIDGLDQSTVFVLIYSSNANESQHVLREVERAISKNKIVIPFRLEDVPPSRGLEYCISLPHWIDALTPPLQEHIDRLVKTVAANVEVQSKHDSPIANVTENTTSHSTALSRNDKHKTRREYFSRACELVLTFALLAIGLILLRQGAILRNQYFIAGFLMLLSTICYVFARIAFLLTSWLGCDGKEKFWACSISALTAIFLLQFGTNLIGPDPYGVPVWIAQKLWGTDIFSSTESDGIWRSNTDPWIEYSFISDSGILHSPEILGWRQTPLSNITSVQILVRQSQEVIYGTCFGTRHEYRVVFAGQGLPDNSNLCFTDKERATVLVGLLAEKFKHVEVSHGVSSIFSHFAFYESLAFASLFLFLAVKTWGTAKTRNRSMIIWKIAFEAIAISMFVYCVYVIRDVYFFGPIPNVNP